MPTTIAPAADFYGNADASPGPARVAQLCPLPPRRTYREPARPPCSFYAAHALLFLFEIGIDTDFQPTEYARLFLPWQTRAALKALEQTRSALLPFDSYARSRCAVNVTSQWEVI